MYIPLYGSLWAMAVCSDKLDPEGLHGRRDRPPHRGAQAAGAALLQRRDPRGRVRPAQLRARPGHPAAPEAAGARPAPGRGAGGRQVNRGRNPIPAKGASAPFVFCGTASARRDAAAAARWRRRRSAREIERGQLRPAPAGSGRRRARAAARAMPASPIIAATISGVSPFGIALVGPAPEVQQLRHRRRIAVQHRGHEVVELRRDRGRLRQGRNRLERGRVAGGAGSGLRSSPPAASARPRSSPARGSPPGLPRALPREPARGRLRSRRGRGIRRLRAWLREQAPRRLRSLRGRGSRGRLRLRRGRVQTRDGSGGAEADRVQAGGWRRGRCATGAGGRAWAPALRHRRRLRRHRRLAAHHRLEVLHRRAHHVVGAR